MASNWIKTEPHVCLFVFVCGLRAWAGDQQLTIPRETNPLFTLPVLARRHIAELKLQLGDAQAHARREAVRVDSFYTFSLYPLTRPRPPLSEERLAC